MGNYCVVLEHGGPKWPKFQPKVPRSETMRDCTVDDLGQIFDLLSAWKLKSKNAPRDLKFDHNVAI